MWSCLWVHKLTHLADPGNKFILYPNDTSIKFHTFWLMLFNEYGYFKVKKKFFFLNAIHYEFFNQTDSSLFPFYRNNLQEKEKGREGKGWEKKLHILLGLCETAGCNHILILLLGLECSEFHHVNHHIIGVARKLGKHWKDLLHQVVSMMSNRPCLSRQENMNSQNGRKKQLN